MVSRQWMQQSYDNNSKSFVEIDHSFTFVVKLGDGLLKKVEGKGTIVVHTKEGNQKFILDVLYVPSLSQNLLSVGQLLRKGYSLHFVDGVCIVYDKKNKLTVGLPSIQNNDNICEGCIYGKMHRLPFPKTAQRARAPLKLVHADICGLTRTSSLINKRYFLLFVDDNIRMMQIYSLDQKLEAFSFFFFSLKLLQNGKVIIK